jgi:hypothetical protein
MPEGRGSINPDSNGELDKRRGFPPSPNASFPYRNNVNIKASDTLGQNSRSHINVSHKMLVWPGVVRHIRYEPINKSVVARTGVNEDAAWLCRPQPKSISRTSSMIGC